MHLLETEPQSEGFARHRALRRRFRQLQVKAFAKPRRGTAFHRGTKVYQGFKGRGHPARNRMFNLVEGKNTRENQSKWILDPPET